MTDITPLPSPLMPEDSPGPWRRSLIARPGSSGSLGSVKEEVLDYLSTPTRSSSGTRKKKTYPNLVSAAVESSSSANAQFRKNVSAHARNRSLSEFASEALHNVRPRNTTIVGPYDPQLEATRPGVHMQREAYLAEQRGFVQPAASAGAGLPTPPPSNRSVNESEEEEVRDEESHPGSLTVRVGPDMRKRRYRPVRRLGQGTFSKVVLATSQSIPPNAVLDEGSEAWLDPKYLVAIKIVEHGPAGGADEERVELGLKREVEVLRSISHPSLIHLKAFDCNETEALLVLNYCPGGDLFDLTSAHHDFLQQKVVQRIFSELVGAVRYLHSKWIVHRDIKLENTLLNVPVSALPTIADPLTYPHPLVTLTDLGLSRKIPEPPASPLLTTRCGSEDYAAPEIMLSQPYDGRQTDAWALGVLLYALMEGRLPFDAPPPRPGAKPIRGRSRTGHRIARCEWIWCRFGDDDGDWDATRGAGWEEARECVEGLLRKVSRGRYSLDELAEKKWVKEGIQTEGGLVREPHADEDMDG
ncbi:kinase-like protein [Trichodelitschia bisporula]|uniref:Kinase-like protein n=1 Tax=Trichodelitschia bisporula TaxID=703511 RepID=A0A6G1HYN5_9PEZI|nr:kinase-like protein [Trichodelitschia bisporula]